MCVAAHPDDEDGTSLIVMRHKYGAHTVSLFSTFGEGGQNAIGPNCTKNWAQFARGKLWRRPRFKAQSHTFSV
jgi:hypothetical protein